MTYDELPFTGIATFFKAPHVAAPTRADADVAVLGVPYDEGTTYRSGARMGPRALRDASTMWAFQQDHEPLLRRRGRRGAARRRAAGPTAATWPLGPMWAAERYHQAVVERLQPLFEAGLFPVTLGGDHSITYPVLKALYQARGGRAVPARPVRHPHGLLGRGGRPALLARQPHHPRRTRRGWLSGLTQYGIRSLHTVRRQHRAGTEPRRAHLLVRAGEGRSRPSSSSTSSSTASTRTSPSTSTRSTRPSRRPPARPSRAGSATTRPRRSCSPSASAST